jgi:hypothetical protein
MKTDSIWVRLIVKSIRSLPDMCISSLYAETPSLCARSHLTLLTQQPMRETQATMDSMDAAIVLLTDPLHSSIGFYQSDVQTKFSPRTSPSQTLFKTFASSHGLLWSRFIQFWKSQTIPKLFVSLDDFIYNPVDSFSKIYRFMGYHFTDHELTCLIRKTLQMEMVSLLKSYWFVESMILQASNTLDGTMARLKTVARAPICELQLDGIVLRHVSHRPTIGKRPRFI